MARAQKREDTRRPATGTSLAVFEQNIIGTEPDFKKLALAARRGIDFGREYNFALSIFSESDQLQRCHPDSFIESFNNLGAMGLSLNKNLGQAALVPRWNTKRRSMWATAMPMYRGLISLATGGSVIKNVWGASVIDEDDIQITLGSMPEINHRPKMRKAGEGGRAERENMLGSYCCADIAGSEKVHATWVPIDEIIAIAERSESYNPKPRTNRDTGVVTPARAPSGPWVSDWGQMAVKSAFRRAFKTWPGVDKVEYTALQEAVRVDTHAETLEQAPPEAETKPDEAVEAEACLPKGEAEELAKMCEEKGIKPAKMAEAYGRKVIADLPAELYLEVKGRIQRAQKR